MSIEVVMETPSEHQPLSAEQRTQALDRKFLPVDLLDGNPLNPNVMSDAEFNLLYDNIEKMGVTDPILVRPVGNRYRIVGGHHRYDVAKLAGLTQVPVTVITDPDFDDDMEAFQAVRHNMIRGKMSADKFMKLYASLSDKYEDEVAAELFGFTDEEDFRKMVREAGKSLPKEMQAVFAEAAKEIKTIDDLAKVLNRLFTEYGADLPWGFMVFDFGGHEHIWVRMEKKGKMQFLMLCDWCRKQQRSVDQVMIVLLQLIADGNLSQEELLQSIAKLQPVVLKNDKLPVEQEQKAA